MRACGVCGTCLDGVNSYNCDCDPRFQETEIDGGQECENPDDRGACTVSRTDENPMRAIIVEKRVGERGGRLVIIQRQVTLPRYDNHLFFD